VQTTNFSSGSESCNPMWLGGEGIVRAFFAEVVMTWNVDRGQAHSSLVSGPSLDAELAAHQEAKELLASLGEVPCVEAGRAAEGGLVWVYPSESLVGDEEADPYRQDHLCSSWIEALARIKVYVELFNAGPVGAA
jgi:hypothetical protein